MEQITSLPSTVALSLLKTPLLNSPTHIKESFKLYPLLVGYARIFLYTACESFIFSLKYVSSFEALLCLIRQICVHMSANQDCLVSPLASVSGDCFLERF